jgi:hypothetical protein
MRVIVADAHPRDNGHWIGCGTIACWSNTLFVSFVFPMGVRLFVKAGVIADKSAKNIRGAMQCMGASRCV